MSCRRLLGLLLSFICLSSLCFADNNAISQQVTKKSKHTTHIRSEQQHRALYHNRRTKSRRHKHRGKTKQESVMRYFGGTPVITSPFLGIRSEFDSSDLIINLPSVNEDLRLLQQRYLLNEQVVKLDQKIPTVPLIELSGKLQARIQFMDPYVGSYKNDVNLDSMELDGVIHSHEWVTGFFAIAYDNSSSPFRKNRTSHSRLFLDEGFFVIGNLHRTPYYFSAGQVVVPFGTYNSHMIEPSFVEALGTTKQRAFTLGYKQPGTAGLFANVYYFKGSIKNRGRNQGGAHVGYVYQNNGWQAEFASSVISSFGDTNTLQMTGGSDFKGFSYGAMSEYTDHTVPAFHVYGLLSHNNFDVIAEYLTALRRFAISDLEQNGCGAKPWAVNAEGSWHFKTHERPAAVAVAYGQSGNTFGLELPEKRISGLFKVSAWRDTIQAIEIRHDINYRGMTTASGSGNAVSTTAVGKTATTLTAKMTVFF